MAALATDFAPAECSSPEELERQRSYFTDHHSFGDLLDHVPDLVMILNENRQVVYANRMVVDTARAASVDAVIGMRPGKVLGCKHSCEEPGGCGTTKFCRYCGLVNAVLETQKGRFAIEECRITAEGPEAEEALDLRVWASPAEVNGEKFAFVTAADIGHEKRRTFLERIFLHDLMNTAAALRGYSDLLREEDGQPETRDACVRRIRLLSNQIIDEIVAQRQLIAAENGELEVHLQRIRPAAILRDVYDSCNHPDFLSGRKLHVAEDVAEVVFVSDPLLLARVLGNMTRNAIEGSVPGETVTLGCRAAHNEVQFWVHNPAFMPEKVRLQIFSRSFSTKGAGRGLGTYSMKYLTERYLGGRIVFASTEGEGTTFKACYPLKQERD